MHPLHGFAVRPRRPEILGFVATLLSLAVSLLPHSASALPVFARQTGQNCVACHAGGQFPELTPYGRMFKLTGYTIGTRTVPLSVMAVGTYAKLASTTDAANGTPHETYAKDGSALLFSSGSLFIAARSRTTSAPSRRSHTITTPASQPTATGMDTVVPTTSNSDMPIVSSARARI